MSHVVKIQLVVKDLDALEAACQSLGLELRRGQRTYRWYGRSVGDTALPEGFREEDLGKCDHAISLPNKPQAYEIGVVATPEGYTLLWDFFAGGYGMEAVVGPSAVRLQDAYSIEYTTRLYQQDGFMVTRTRDENGETVLECER